MSPIIFRYYVTNVRVRRVDTGFIGSCHHLQRHAVPLVVSMLAVLLVVLGFAIPSTRAAEPIVFTTTADFDAGTKSQPTPADGNYQIVTATDHLGVASGSLKLDDKDSDRFTLDDTDADTWKWTPAQGTLTPAATISHEEIGHGEYHLTTTGGNVGWDRGLVLGDSIATGNLDARAKVTTTEQALFRIFDTQDFYPLEAGTDGYELEYEPGVAADAWNVTNGVRRLVATAPCATDATPTPTATTAFIRITRTGTDWDFYFSSDGTSYTQLSENVNCVALGQTTNDPTKIGPWVVIVAHNPQGVTGSNFRFDEWSVSVPLESRTSGTWTSTTQTFTGEVPVRVTLTQNIPSVLNYVDYISILDSTLSQILWQHNGDFSAATDTLTVEFSGSLMQNWVLRVAMRSTLQALNTVDSITVDLGPPPGNGGGGGDPIVIVPPIVPQVVQLLIRKALELCNLWLLVFLFLVMLTVVGIRRAKVRGPGVRP